jgi:5-methyltetrahydropteroyltriglutamate--homocysteine methyltransferase
MKNSAQKIRTSLVGRLPVPPGFEEAAFRLPRGEVNDEEMAAQIVPVVAGVVKRQVDIGLDCFGDGEYWSALDIKWFDQQMSGLNTRPLKPGEVGSMRESTRERDVFRTLYADMDRVGTIACIPGERPRPPARERIIVNGPIKTRGTAATQRASSAASRRRSRAQVSPWTRLSSRRSRRDGSTISSIMSTTGPRRNSSTRSPTPCATSTGRSSRQASILQIDDPGIATSWDMLKPEPSLPDYQKYVTLRIDALNHALAGIPPENVRYHWCWGSWHGSHINDLPLEHIIEVALKVKAQTYSFEAANVRHQHEMDVWKETKPAPGTILMPGVISHATNLVEHPELIARRLVNWAHIVGRENVVAGADCGIGGRVHAEISWAKLAALTKGAALATKTLWH